jgi:hypothetical protein
MPITETYTVGLERWAGKQITAMVALGVNVLDAQKAVRAFMEVLPPGADPDTHIVPAHFMAQDITRKEYTDDAVSAWVSDERIPSRFKLLLVASAANA